MQTNKDLEKPWAALATPKDRASPSSIASSRSASPVSTSTSFTHSAATTILIDDSHAKAALQPYNHLCVREYTRSQRNADLTALGLNLEHRTPRTPPPPPPPPAALETTAPLLPQDEETAHAVGKRNKRKRGKERQEEQSEGDAEETSLDETLLAVIGILHAARLQSNVAGWLRAGALLRSRPQQQRQHTPTEWFDDPVLMSEWACRGREAMSELGLAIEHGVKS